VQPDGRHQRAAIILAEELNFTRAADRLRITQSALSRQIVELEELVGFTVFRRDPKRVEVTEPGQVYVRGCMDAHALLDKALRLAKATQDSVLPHITIGHSPYVDPALISAILSTQLPLYPDLRFRIESMFVSDLAHGILTAELDLAIIGEPPDHPSLTLAPISNSPLYVAMPSDHPASKQDSVSLADFGQLGWIVFPKRAHPTLYSRIFEACRLAAVSPIEVHHYVSPQEAAYLIRQNFGIALIAAGVAEQIAERDIVAKPLSDRALTVTTYLAVHADQSSRLVNEFGIAFLRKMSAKSNSAARSGQLALAL
jgi:DNA-binding transcriptional LysR family regulator